jgi:hypothetical protein
MEGEMKKNKIYWAGLKIVALILLFVVSSLGTGLQSARAEYYADNFDDNVKGDEWCLNEYHPGSATLEENNSRLEFTADAGVLEGADYVLCGKLLNTSQNFSCKVDWHLSKAIGAGTFAVCLGLVVPSVDEDIVIGAGYGDGNLYFSCFSEAAGIDYTLSRSATDGIVYISYDATQDKLYLSINGFWLNENQAAGDWAFQGLLQGAWANKSVFAYLEGDAEAAEAIEVGDAWFDNFEINFNTPTYDATGAWDYTDSGHWNNCGEPNPGTEQGTDIIIQKGDSFTLVTDEWTVTDTVADNVYSATRTFYEDGGWTTATFTVTASSSTQASGTVNWTWSGSGLTCSGGHQTSLTKQQQNPPTYDATGTWDYSDSGHWNNCGEPNDPPESGPATITQSGNRITVVDDQGRSYDGFVSGLTYTFVRSYPEDAGITSEVYTVSLTTGGTSGSGACDWVWNDDSDSCNGGFSFSLVKQQALPSVDIKANGSDGPVALSSQDSLSVTVAVDNAGSTDDADWWLAADTPFGLFFYTFQEWTDLLLPIYQGPLFNLGSFELLNFPGSVLPAGTYTFYFGVDTVMDGDITAEYLYFDFVEVNISEPPCTRCYDHHNESTGKRIMTAIIP